MKRAHLGISFALLLVACPAFFLGGCDDDPATGRDAALDTSSDATGDLAQDISGDGADTGSDAGADLGSDASDTGPDAADGQADASLDGDAGDARDLAADGGADADLSIDAGPNPTRDAGASAKAPGPFGVGFSEAEVRYTPEGQDEERILRLAVWYPTRDTEGQTAAYQRWLRRPGVIRDARLVPGRELPLFVFSHGNGGFGEQSFFMTEFLASHGWVVMAPDHTGNTLTDMTVPTERLLDWRPQDISAVIDAAYDPEAVQPTAGHLGDDLVVGGHSFGGYTTLALTGAPFDIDALDAECPDLAATPPCRYYREGGARGRLIAGYLDERIDAAVAFAPAGNPFFDLDGLSAIDLPFLLVTGALDATTPNLTQGDPIWEGLEGDDKVRVDLATGGHFTFSNACDIAPTLGDGCGPLYVDQEEAFPALNAYVLVFARRALWDDEVEAGVIDGSEDIFDDATITTHSDD